MIDFASSFTQFFTVTFISLFLGMLFILLLRETAHVSVRSLSAFAFGLLFWFFLDTLNDAIQLDVNEGYSYGFHHVALLFLFLVGFLSLALLSGHGVSTKVAAKEASTSSSAYLVSILVALGMGFHGIGEGLEFGGTSAGTSAVTVLDAIGGFGGGIAYVFHKFLEATIVMTVYLALTADENVGLRKQLWRIVSLGLAFGLPSAVGDVVGYYVPVDSSYFYALGGGAALFVALMVVKPIFGGIQQREVTFSDWVRIVIALLLGFLALYFAASFHAG